MEKIKTKAEKYGKGNVWIGIIKFALPVVMLYFVGAAYQFIDSIFVAKYVIYDGLVYDYTGMTATAALVPISILSFATIILGSVGFGSKFSNSLGRNNEYQIKKDISSGYALEFICLFILSIIILVFTQPLFKLMLNKQQQDISLNDNSANIITDARNYMFIFLFCFISMGIRDIMSRQLRSEGHVTTASLIPLISIPVNLTLDYVLMDPNIGNLGLIGAAFASLIAEIVIYPFLITLIWKYKSKNQTHYEWNILKFGVDWKLVKQMVIIGFVPFFVQASIGITQLLSTTVISTSIPKNTPKEIGDWFTLVSIASRPSYLILSASLGIGASSISYIGYNYGFGNVKRTFESTKAMYVWSFILMFFIFIFTSIFSTEFLDFFEADVGEQKKQMEIALIFWTLGTVLSQVVNRVAEYSSALNKPRGATLILASSMWVIYLGSLLVIWLLIKFSNLDFYYIVYFYFIYSLLTLLINGPMIYFLTLKHKKEMIKTIQINKYAS